jgi:hypothetical protein
MSILAVFVIYDKVSSFHSLIPFPHLPSFKKKKMCRIQIASYSLGYSHTSYPDGFLIRGPNGFRAAIQHVCHCNSVPVWLRPPDVTSHIKITSLFPGEVRMLFFNFLSENVVLGNPSRSEVVEFVVVGQGPYRVRAWRE